MLSRMRLELGIGAEAAGARRILETYAPQPLVCTEALPEVDCLVVGSVAFGRERDRRGNDAGDADLEDQILRRLGRGPVPVVTIVHPVQIVAALERDSTDLPIVWIVKPDAAQPIEPEPVAPAGIDGSRVTDRDFDAMPVLRDLYDAWHRDP